MSAVCVLFEKTAVCLRFDKSICRCQLLVCILKRQMFVYATEEFGVPNMLFVERQDIYTKIELLDGLIHK